MNQTSLSVHGIHHITAIASDPQKTCDFYSSILGLRLVKKSVNQDDVHTYHLFFGDKEGNPGMDLTFFTFQPAMPGRRGTGLVTTISLAVPESALDFWVKRFDFHNIKHEGITAVYDVKTIVFYDFDNQELELVGVPADKLMENENVWSTNEIAKEVAIRYFDSATLSVTSLAEIEPVLLLLGYEQLQTDDNVSLYQIPGKMRAAFLVVEEHPDQEAGVNLAGTVHHIAFAVDNEEQQKEFQIRLLHMGLRPTPIIDRFYFKSVYFRTPAGILFELATEGPGFTADEKLADLGKKLALPPFLEDQRQEIEAGLEPIFQDEE